MSRTYSQVYIGETFREAFWPPVVVLLLWAVADRGFNAYTRYPWLDMPTHFGGGIAVAHLFWIAILLLEASLGSVHIFFRLLLTVGLTALTAVLWEFLEFLSDLLLGSHLNLGVTDTLSDLFFGMLGSLTLPVLHILQRVRAAVRPAADSDR